MIDDVGDGVFELTGRAVHAAPNLALSVHGKSPVRTSAVARLESNPTATGAGRDGNQWNLPDKIVQNELNTLPFLTEPLKWVFEVQINDMKSHWAERTRNMKNLHTDLENGSLIGQFELYQKALAKEAEEAAAKATGSGFHDVETSLVDDFEPENLCNECCRPKGNCVCKPLEIETETRCSVCWPNMRRVTACTRSLIARELPPGSSRLARFTKFAVRAAVVPHAVSAASLFSLDSLVDRLRENCERLW